MSEVNPLYSLLISHLPLHFETVQNIQTFPIYTFYTSTQLNKIPFPHSTRVAG